MDNQAYRIGRLQAAVECMAIRLEDSSFCQGMYNRDCEKFDQYERACERQRAALVRLVEALVKTCKEVPDGG